MSHLPTYTIIDPITWGERGERIKRNVIPVVCAKFGVTPFDIRGASRKPEYAHPRIAAAYLLRSLTNLSFSEIAVRMGGRDHTTIIYAVKRAPQLAAKNPVYASRVGACFSELRGGE